MNTISKIKSLGNKLIQVLNSKEEEKILKNICNKFSLYYYNIEKDDEYYYSIVQHILLKKLKELDNKFIIDDSIIKNEYLNTLDIFKKCNINDKNIIKDFFRLLDGNKIKKTQKTNYMFLPVANNIKNKNYLVIKIIDNFGTRYIKIKKSNIINFEFHNDTIKYILFNNETINETTNLYYNEETRPDTIYIVSLFKSNNKTENDDNNNYYCISFNFDYIKHDNITDNLNYINNFKKLLDKDNKTPDELNEVNLLILLYTLINVHYYNNIYSSIIEIFKYKLQEEKKNNYQDIFEIYLSINNIKNKILENYLLSEKNNQILKDYIKYLTNDYINFFFELLERKIIKPTKYELNDTDNNLIKSISIREYEGYDNYRYIDIKSDNIIKFNFYDHKIELKPFNKSKKSNINEIYSKTDKIYILSLTNDIIYNSFDPTIYNNDYYCILFNFDNITKGSYPINIFKELFENPKTSDELNKVNLFILLYTLNYLNYKEGKKGGSSIKKSYQLYMNDKNRYYIIYNNKNIYLNKNNTYKKDNCLYLKINNNLDVNIKIN